MFWLFLVPELFASKTGNGLLDFYTMLNTDITKQRVLYQPVINMENNNLYGKTS